MVYTQTTSNMVEILVVPTCHEPATKDTNSYLGPKQDIYCNGQTCVFTEEISSLKGHDKFVHGTLETNYQLAHFMLYPNHIKKVLLRPMTCFIFH